MSKLVLHNDGDSFLCMDCGKGVPRTRSNPYPDHVCDPSADEPADVCEVCGHVHARRDECYPPDDEQRKEKLDEWWGECVESPPDDELARLEREIARNEVLSWFEKGLWHRIDPQEADWSVSRYGILSGLLEHHPTEPNLVRVKEKGK